MYYIIAPLLLSCIVALLLGQVLIPYLKSKKLGQKILDIGPRWHKSKEGTPIMGGLLFIMGILASILVFGIAVVMVTNDICLFINFAMAIAYATIGFLDDFVKLFKKRNKGLSPVQKLMLQFFIGIMYILTMVLTGNMGTLLIIPFVNISIDLGFFYYIFVLVGLVAFVNSANLTDGIDGLLGSVTAIIALFFTFVFYKKDHTTGLVYSSSILGGMIGYLFYNFHPAKVFMGDTGSLFIGAAIAGMALWLNMPLILFMVGIVYIVEELSVIMQVTSFKLTGKRIFKMSPLHHHFELCGWKEVKIVAVFSVVTAIGCIISYIGIF